MFTPRKVQPGSGLAPVELAKRFSTSTTEEVAELGREVHLLVYPMTKVNVRLVVHCNLTEDMIKMAEEKIRFVFTELRLQMHERLNSDATKWVFLLKFFNYRDLVQIIPNRSYEVDR